MSETALNGLAGLAPVDWKAVVDAMLPEERREACKALEILSERTGRLARYIDERHGGGCGDQGHESAVKACNRAGRAIRERAFGYSGSHDLTI